jgi:2,3-bisphosphoglycerate-independent phosphoglycerate mutase
LPRRPLVALVILDGWGCAPAGPGNAVELASTPVFDRLWRTYPRTTLAASGEAVGLPSGQMGNSEVGHLTIGAGRRLYQDLMRVNSSIADGSFFANPALVSAFERAATVHLVGLLSHGGVHSHIDHLRALLRLAPEKTWIHAITDGRDVSPTSAVRDLAELPLDRVATVVGRYYAMDRDKRWERTDRALAALLMGMGTHVNVQNILEEVQTSYARGVTDEFLEPIVVDGAPRIGPEDAIVFFNFRPDRARQLTQRFLERNLDVTTMTRYRDDFSCPVAFEEQDVSETLAEVLSEHGVRQLHVSETEKYAHVTYFFNGGREKEWPGEDRILVPSPRDVPSYEHKPEMSAQEVTDRFCDHVGDGYGFAVVNFPNPDMVGHTGSIPAATRAVETADACLGRVVDAVGAVGGVCLVTADHGNAEQMLEPDGVLPHTAHTTNPVPLIVTDAGVSVRDGAELADLAPTVLDFLGLTKPAKMTGETLIFAGYTPASPSGTDTT